MADAATPDRQGYFFEDLSVGMAAAFAKTVTDADIVLYAGLSGDTNPVHIDDEYAAATPFKGRIAHGLLTAAFISAVLGSILPGPGAIYLSQTLRFKAPVRPGDTVRARAQVTAVDPQRKRVTLETICTVGDRTVIEGEAVVMVPSRG